MNAFREESRHEQQETFDCAHTVSDMGAHVFCMPRE